jgi:hypothetical protein
MRQLPGFLLLAAQQSNNPNILNAENVGSNNTGF